MSCLKKKKDSNHLQQDALILYWFVSFIIFKVLNKNTLSFTYEFLKSRWSNLYGNYSVEEYFKIVRILDVMIYEMYTLVVFTVVFV